MYTIGTFLSEVETLFVYIRYIMNSMPTILNIFIFAVVPFSCVIAIYNDIRGLRS